MIPTWVLKIGKLILMRDTDPEEMKKPWYERRSYWGIFIAVVGAILYYWQGLVLDNDTVDLIWDNWQVIVSSVKAAIAAGLVIYGIIMRIIGQVKHQQKVTAELQKQTLLARCTPTVGKQSND